MRLTSLALSVGLSLWACGENSKEATGGSGGTSGRGGSAGYGGVACFEAGMRVATPRGSVPIELLRVGDEVLAFDERTGSVTARPITSVFVHNVAESGRLALDDGRILRVTAEHPIYVAERGAYVAARDISGSASLVTLSRTLAPKSSSPDTGSSISSPVALARTSASGFAAHDSGAPVPVYNISVQDLENYFVEGVLVHNKTPCYDCRCMGTCTGGASGIGGTGDTGGTGGCTPQPWAAGGCEGPTTCLVPSNEWVLLNQLVGAGSGGDGPGAGGEGGAPAGGAPGAGAPGDGMPQRFYTGTVTQCSLPATPDEGRFLAVDFLMPTSMPPITTEFPAFALYDGGPCAGELMGEVWLSPNSLPEPGTWTTQCVHLPPGSNSSAMLSFHIMVPPSGLKNMRLVAGCECRREFRRACLPPQDSGGSGVCEASRIDGGT